MIPAGYMYKKVASGKGWMRLAHVRHICSLSGCISRHHELYDPGCYFLPNRNKLADSPDVFALVAELEGVHFDTADHVLFYYEMYEKEYDEERRTWDDIDPEAGDTVEPAQEVLFLGFDIVQFDETSWGTGCSPLSCERLCEDIPVNQYCLIDSLAEAVAVLQRGRFDNCEPGPYRIFSVYRAL